MTTTTYVASTGKRYRIRIFPVGGVSGVSAEVAHGNGREIGSLNEPCPWGFEKSAYDAAVAAAERHAANGLLGEGWSKLVWTGTRHKWAPC